MTIPRIEHIAGSRYSENIALVCTGCQEPFTYSVRQYKGDFGCNISDFEHFVQWAKWDAAQHECFLAGRVGYIEEPPDVVEDDLVYDPLDHNCPTCGKSAVLFVDGDCPECNPPIVDDPLVYHVDFPQEDLEKLAADGGKVVERHEDPWGGVGYIVEPEDDDPLDFEPDCFTCGARSRTFIDGDCPKCNPPIEDEEDNLDAWMNEELDLPPIDYRHDALSVDEALDLLDDDDMDGGYWPDEFDEDEDYYEHADLDDDEPFGFIYDWQDPRFVLTITGRITVRHPTLREVPRLRNFPSIEIDFAGIEQRIVDQLLLDADVYSLDAHGCLRDEKGHCLACLRPGPHLPFHYKRPQ